MRAAPAELIRGTDQIRHDAALDGVAERCQLLGGGILRYGLVGILVYLGAFKFTRTEAEAIQPLLANSPLLGWLYGVTTIQGASNLLGCIELGVATLLVLRPLAPRAAAIGSLVAIGIFLTTLSFLISTPDAWQQAPDFPLPIPGLVGGFVLKDVFLLGAAVWSAGEALGAARPDRR